MYIRKYCIYYICIYNKSIYKYKYIYMYLLLHWFCFFGEPWLIHWPTDRQPGAEVTAFLRLLHQAPFPGNVPAVSYSLWALHWSTCASASEGLVNDVSLILQLLFLNPCLSSFFHNCVRPYSYNKSYSIKHIMTLLSLFYHEWYNIMQKKMC